MYVVKFQGGASGVTRSTREKAIAVAVIHRPARVYEVGRPNVLVAVVDANGKIENR